MWVHGEQRWYQELQVRSPCTNAQIELKEEVTGQENRPSVVTAPQVRSSLVAQLKSVVISPTPPIAVPDYDGWTSFDSGQPVWGTTYPLPVAVAEIDEDEDQEDPFCLAALV